MRCNPTKPHHFCPDFFLASWLGVCAYVGLVAISIIPMSERRRLNIYQGEKDDSPATARSYTCIPLQCRRRGDHQAEESIRRLHHPEGSLKTQVKAGLIQHSRDPHQREERQDQPSLMLTTKPDETIEVGANPDQEMIILVTQNRGTSLDPGANRDPDPLLETIMNTIHKRDGGANQNLLRPGANTKQRATEANPILDQVHLKPKVAVVAKETKHKQNRSMQRNGSKNLPHRPRRLSPPTFV